MLGESWRTRIPLTKIPASTAVQLQMESKIVVGCWFSCRGPQFLKATASGKPRVKAVVVGCWFSCRGPQFLKATASGKPRVKAVTAADHTRTLQGRFRVDISSVQGAH